jgi:AcrR family transcriptional regulator
MTTPRQDSSETRDSLLRAAERLMAQRGAYAVDLKDIREAAGQRNRSAIHYYFGDRDGLIEAIRQKHRVPINDHRNQVLDELGPDATIAELIDAFILPLAHGLDDDSARDYMIMVGAEAAWVGAAISANPDRPYFESLRRTGTLLAQRLPGSAQRRKMLVGQAFMTATVLLADIARELNSGTIDISTGRARVTGVSRFVKAALEGSVEERP